MEELNFKRLIVWQKSMEFAEKCLDTTFEIKGHYRLLEQLEASSASNSQNIAEGNGRLSLKEYIQYLYISRGSLYESITLLDLFARKGPKTADLLIKQEEPDLKIVKM